MSKSEKRTELEQLGEFGLIDELTKDFEPINDSTIKSIGDDAAVLAPTKNQRLISTDLLVEGIHFDLMYTPLKHLGYKSAVVNFSDIVAMNGTPKQMIVGLAVSNRFSLEALKELYAGFKAACKKYNVDLVGGDTTSSSSGLFISVSIVGEAPEEDVVYRSTAMQGDLLCVTGDLGGAYMGLMLLEREKKVFRESKGANIQPDLSGFDYILGRQLRPEARLDIVQALKKLDVKPTSMIDISDGLASEALHIARDSGLGVNLYEEKIPIDYSTHNMAEQFKLVPSLAALNGGEDYELLFTIDQKDYDKIKGMREITVIGHMVDKSFGENLITNDNCSIPLKAQGWDHMKQDSEKK
ncbi:MAG: thiamine-phosphate kinase [Bacteroidales bacterium]